jgi:hypothetical protein
MCLQLGVVTNFMDKLLCMLQLRLFGKVNIKLPFIGAIYGTLANEMA